MSGLGIDGIMKLIAELGVHSFYFDMNLPKIQENHL